MEEITEIPDLEAIRQEHESWLAELEGLAVQAIASANWIPVLEHLNEIMAWQDSQLHEAQKASTKSLSRSGADLLPTTAVNDVRNKTHHVTTTRTNAETTGVDGFSQRAGDNAPHP